MTHSISPPGPIDGEDHAALAACVLANGMQLGLAAGPRPVGAVRHRHFGIGVRRSWSAAGALWSGFHAALAAQWHPFDILQPNRS